MSKIIQLDTSRRFIQSYKAAFELWLSYPKSFLFMLGPWAFAAGLICTAAFLGCEQFHSNYITWQELCIYIIGWAGISYLCGVMRTCQIEFLSRYEKATTATDDKKVFQTNKFADNTSDITNPKALSLWKREDKLSTTLANSLKSALPLFVAGLMFGGLYILSEMTMNYWIASIICIAIAILLPFSSCATTQSFIEIQRKPFIKSLGKGFMLNKRYYGSQLGMWVLSGLIFTLCCFVIFFGEAIIFSLFNNREAGEIIDEVVEIPTYIYIFKYAIAFVGSAIIFGLSPMWSLPQQIHMQSILIKEKEREVKLRGCQNNKN